MRRKPPYSVVVYWDQLGSGEQDAVREELSTLSGDRHAPEWWILHEGTPPQDLRALESEKPGLALFALESLASLWKITPATLLANLPAAGFLFAAKCVRNDYFSCLDGTRRFELKAHLNQAFSEDGRVAARPSWNVADIQRRQACLAFFGSPSKSLIEPLPEGPPSYHRCDVLGFATALAVRLPDFWERLPQTEPFPDPVWMELLYSAFLTHRYGCLDARYAWETTAEDTITSSRKPLPDPSKKATSTGDDPTSPAPAPISDPICLVYRLFPGPHTDLHHQAEVVLETLDQLLSEEAALPGCEQRWLLHGTIAPDFKQAVIRRLAAHGQAPLQLPSLGANGETDWLQARQYALEEGFATAKCVLPLFWNFHLPPEGWQSFHHALKHQKQAPVLFLAEESGTTKRYHRRSPATAAYRSTAPRTLRVHPENALDAPFAGWFRRLDFPVTASNAIEPSLPRPPREEAYAATPLYFLIPLKARASAASWAEVVRNLRATTASIMNNRSGDWHIVLIGHDAPPLPEVPRNRFSFVQVTHPTPQSRVERILDKTTKERAGAAWLRNHREGQAFSIALLDADDLVHNTFVENALEQCRRVNGGLHPTEGHLLDVNASPPALVLEPTIFRKCGSGFVQRFSRIELPEDANDQSALFSSFRHHKLFLRRALRLDRLPGLAHFCAVGYRINHEESESIQSLSPNRKLRHRWRHNAFELPPEAARKCLRADYGYPPDGLSSRAATLSANVATPLREAGKSLRTGIDHSLRLLRDLSKELRPLWPKPMPDAVTAIKRTRPVKTGPLLEAYRATGLAKEPDTFVLYRIIGNDLPPRHQSGQSLANLRFILDHEPPLPACEKRFVINRIIDPATEAGLIALLEEREVPFLHLPFERGEYAAIPPDLDCLPQPDYLETNAFQGLSAKNQNRLRVAVRRHQNNYVMHNNGARNAALDDGRHRAKWVAPFDGNCFFTAKAWESLCEAVKTAPHLPYQVVPMARILDNEKLLDPAYCPPATEEPQLLFRRDAVERFNPAFPYGRRPKVELFWRLGVPGPWDYWTDKSWDQPRRKRSQEAGNFGLAGWVARLFSGKQSLEVPGKQSPSHRGLARQTAILQLLEKIDQSISRDSHP